MEKVGDTRGSPVSFLREMTRQSVVLDMHKHPVTMRHGAFILAAY
jgi:hypothetical protein